MRDMYKGEKIPDEEVVFVDGILYIICQKRLRRGVPKQLFGEMVCLDPEYTKPMSLVDIKKKYPHVVKVIYEAALRGAEYTYGNHASDRNNPEVWEKTGENKGYA